MFRTKDAEKIKIRILRSIMSFPENRDINDIMWENAVESERPQMTQKSRACALHAG